MAATQGGAAGTIPPTLTSHQQQLAGVNSQQSSDLLGTLGSNTNNNNSSSTSNLTNESLVAATVSRSQSRNQSRSLQQVTDKCK